MGDAERHLMSGILNILKPPGMTSSNVVTFVRRVLGIKRVGHSGTLDPAAAGVLPVFFGSATRLCEYALSDNKEYIGEICFGASTDTQDAQGSVLQRSDKVISLDEASELFASIQGALRQVPPAYSAIKHKGKKLYEYARAGQEVQTKARDVIIYSSSVTRQTGPNRFLFHVACSKGTYVRTICHDIGETSGAHAHLSFLLRNRTGHFDIADAITLDELERAQQAGRLSDCVLPMDYALDLPKVQLHAAAEKAALNGGTITEADIVHSAAQPDETAAVYVQDAFIGIGCKLPDGIRIKKILR